MTSILEINAENGTAFLERILEIENLSFPSPWSIQHFKQEMKNRFSRIWGSFIHDMLWGYACFWMTGREMQLLNIAVHPQKRGEGLAQQLLKEMISLGHAEGLHEIWLEVRPSNRAAQGLYKKMGFQEVGRRPQYYRDTHEDAILMTLSLFKKEKAISI
jgi:ribosomal-protein-alanine N-acetyltransferase